MATPPRRPVARGRAATSARAGRQPAREPEPPARRRRRWPAFLARLVVYGALFAIGVWGGMLTVAVSHLDELEARTSVRYDPGVVLARDNRTVLRRLRAPETRTYLAESELPEALVDATVSAEDRRFFDHGGVDLRGLARAALVDLRARAAREGGSTITQQLVKNAYVGPDRSLGRKSREALLAVALETRWSKRRILTAYLNTAYFGNGTYGVVDAARTYYGVPVGKLQPHQAAMLAALLRSPEGDNPVSAPGNARAARLRVLTAMHALGKLDDAGFAAAQTAPLPSSARLQRRRRATKELAPQFTDAVVGRLIDHYGTRRALGGGLRATTTLDARLQKAADRAVQQAASKGLDSALVAIDVRSGEVRAMANGGSARRSAFNVALDGHRQPGSAFKPFMLAAAFDNGLAPKSGVLSAPFSQTLPDGTKFRVTNGGGYAGPTTLERATWQSDNTVYARLQQRYGIQAAIDEARAAGITSRIDPVPAAVLGALPEGTTPAELAHAYATFAGHGQRTSMAKDGGPRLLARVREDGSGGATWRAPSVRTQAIPRGIADLVTATLQGVVRTGTGTAASIDRPVAGKTGTTEDYRDAWFVGYTPDVAVAVWVGHARAGIPMRTENGGGPVSGGSIPARIWHDFMTDTTSGTTAHDFTLRAPTFTTVLLDPESGLLAGPWCAGAVRTPVLVGREPTEETTQCPERTRAIPDLVGSPRADARDALDAQTFDAPLRIEERLVSDQAQADLVLVQDPPAGTQVARDTPITLIVGSNPFVR